MRPSIKYGLPLLFLCWSAFPAHSQNKAELEKRYDQLINEIKETEDLLEDTKKSKESTLGEVITIQKKITAREELITNINSQIGLLNGQIGETNEIVEALENDLLQLKDEYADMIYYAYINEDNYDKLNFIFSSDNFIEAFRRIQYIREYTSFRKEQVKLIEAVKESLAMKAGDLTSQKEEKAELLNMERTQRYKLKEEVEQKNAKLATLKNIEQKLASAIEQKRKDAEDLNKRIEAIIAEEIRKEKLRALESASSRGENISTPGEVPTLTPEMRLISSSFESNKGRLPWPVERGTISEKFGKRLHPVLTDPPVYVQNNGLDFNTSANAEVRAVFDGEVVNTIYNPSFQKGVIIKHGEYFSVYTKLKSVFVKPGDKVSTKQTIGIAYTNEETTDSEVHLEIWKGTILMNPEVWISKQ